MLRGWRQGAVTAGALILTALPSASALAAESRVGLVTADGVTIAATYFEPVVRPAPMLLLVHMPTRSRVDWAGVARRFAERGVGALAIDLRGHGESQGGPGPVESYVRDLEAGLVWLAARPEAAPGRIGVMGASLGANLAAIAAAADSRVQALVLLSVTLDFRGLRSAPALQKYGSRPALLLTSREDSYATRSARELSNQAPGVREVWIYEGAGHGTVMLETQPDVVPAVVDWLSARLL